MIVYADIVHKILSCAEAHKSFKSRDLDFYLKSFDSIYLRNFLYNNHVYSFNKNMLVEIDYKIVLVKFGYEKNYIGVMFPSHDEFFQKLFKNVPEKDFKNYDFPLHSSYNVFLKKLNAKLKLLLK